MNKVQRNKVLNSRFERDAQQGFNQVAGSEAFFETIRHPIHGKLVRRQRKSGLKHVITELVIVVGLLGLVKYLFDYPHSEMIVAVPQKQVTPVEPQKQAILENETMNKDVSLVKPIKEVHKRHIGVYVAENSFSHDSIVVAVENPIDQKNEEQPLVENKEAELFRYQDQRPYYKLVYIADLLAIDYSDTIKHAILLSPVLNGVPASFESRVQMPDAVEKPDVLETISDYPATIERGMRYFRAGKFEKCLAAFGHLENTREDDQNVNFYQSLACFELKQYQKCLAGLESLSKMEHCIFEQDVDYYRALCYLNLGNISFAAPLLHKIAFSDSFYKDKASVLLEQIK